jgi:hypothetical protein
MPPTPNMGLALPTVGITLGPTWASEVNAAFTVIDAHNHTTGNGVPIPTNGVSVNADFPFNSFNATLLRSTRYVNQGSPLGLAADLGCLYVSGGNLWYNNTAGQQVQITQGAGLDASTVGGFGGDYGTSTASAFYTSATSTFTFWQAPNTSAFMDMGAIIIHPTNSSTTGVTVSASTSLSSSYNLIFPLALPASTKFLTVDNSGNIGDVYDVDNSTIVVSSNTIQVPAGGITSTQIATGTIVDSNIQDGTISNLKLTANNLSITGTTGNFNTTSTSYVLATSVSITNSGLKAVEFSLQPDGSGNNSILLSSTGNNIYFLQVQRNGAPLYQTTMTSAGSASSMQIPSSVIRFIDYAVIGSSNALTYSVYIKSNTGANIGLLFAIPVARELA